MHYKKQAWDNLNTTSARVQPWTHTPQMPKEINHPMEKHNSQPIEHQEHGLHTQHRWYKQRK